MSESKTDATGVSQDAEKIADGGDEKTPNPVSPEEISKKTKDDEAQAEDPSQRSRWQRVFDTIYWVPPNCRWNPHQPPKFSMAMNVLFAFAGAFTVANLYYNHPILNILAHDFGVPYEKVAQIPTLAQVGYAAGLFFLCPLGDLLKRRPFVLSLVFFTATMSIGLCLTKSLAVFSAIQCITGITTVTPQLMLPLVGDLAPPNRRAAALSVVVSGFVLGILIARLLSGIMANYVSWRYVYWMSVGLQYSIFCLLWTFMPDYPATNKRLNYFKMLWSMILMLTKHPILVQASVISYFTSAIFTNFWTVLTFLLAGPPYNYDPVVIGLFALIGIATMFLTPLYGRHLIDRFVPWFSVILGLSWCMIGACIGAYTGSFTVAGPILQAFFVDFGMQTAQVANRSSIYTVEPKGRNRVNTVFMVFTFLGQITGTSVGAHLFARGGWIGSQSFSVGCIFMALIVTFSRGPWETGWLGWHGGLSILKKNKESADGKAQEVRNPLRRMGTNEGRNANAVTDVEKTAGNEQQDGDVTKGQSEAVDEHAIDDSNAEDDEEISSKSDEDGITSKNPKSK